MSTAPPIDPTAPAPPDWDAIAREVHCPLCDYNLRGLSTPRCPECGYTFVWLDLLNEQLIDHPYLFEHYPTRNCWSFIRTVAGGLNPLAFWRTLVPTHRVMRRRLIVYFLVAAGLTTLLGAGGTWASTIIAFARRSVEQRQLARQAFARGIDPYSGKPMTQSMLDSRLRQYPTPFEFAFWRYVFDWGWLRHRWATRLTLTACAWPMITFATLMIFIRSMLRAKIRLVHVLRCCIYCGDIFIWFGLIALVVKLASFFLLRDERVDAMAIFFLALVMTARLMVAFRKYLHLRHATATVIAAQVVVTLAVITALSLDGDFYFFVL